ncbi:MAG: MazG family protein [Clostridiales bacterium]|nr:MazG family protein [Clostridiales bacterium]
MGRLTIAGLGPGGFAQITRESLEAITQADKVILRTEVHPAAEGLASEGVQYLSCDPFYETGDDFTQVYLNIAEYVLSMVEQYDSVCYCVPGHPLVAEETVRILLQRLDEADTTVLPALSFLDAVFAAVKIDPIQERLSIIDAAPLWDGKQEGIPCLPEGACLFAQVYDPYIAGELKLALLERLPPESPVTILYHVGIKGEERIVPCFLAELDHSRDVPFDHLTSVFLPKSNLSCASTAQYPLDALVQVFRRLLGPGGCPWDQQQTHDTLKPYLLEEANEVLEAIDEQDMAHLQEELGDVLMQIVFHSALAESRGDFDIQDVVTGITDKMIRRHPHVFSGSHADSPEEVMELWQKIKDEEKRAKKE